MASPSPERRLVDGFPVTVLNTRPDIDTAYVFARLGEALALIGRWQPRTLRRLRVDVTGFDVRRYPCRGALFTDTRICLVELTFLGTGRHAVAEIAATIVHEGMHARLAHLGLSARPETLAREERRCRLAELELGLAIPDGAVVVERARQSLALGDAEVAPRIDWAEAQRRVAEADRHTPPRA